MMTLRLTFPRIALATILAGCANTPDRSAPPPAPAPTDGSSIGFGVAPPAATPVPKPAPLRLGIAGDPVLGAADAPVTIVEFLDYECSYCQGYAQEIFPRLKRDYIDTGRVRYVSRDFPLPRHPRARPAAIAAACAGEQGRFWEMHEGLLTGNTPLRDEDIATVATRLRLDASRFAACRAADHHDARLDAAVAAGRRIGVRGTPSFLVGASAGGEARGRLLQGVEDYAALEAAIQPWLKGAAAD